ncbi:MULTISPECIES: YaiO family outer membrane beta-barrel protein [unclassified Cupriavidus]|uniref:YaiO family outer membrane beta-barrel protein n=1 Tax=unclassified Cupriavidus TaxID=2640874 RepID=UPI0028B29956|nr:YaiO family outer membrane beta-barrel protein [Cupriavidus sp. SZY C1]MDT6962684.1 YaiO family outer membrane beta-barrel protein [Cupriavidus sp. SZY C1]
MEKPACHTARFARPLICAGGLLALLIAADASAQAEATPPRTFVPLLTGFVEGGIGHANLTGDNANWNDQYLRGGVHLTPKDYVTGEISHQSHFGDQGTFFGLGYTRIIDDDWYAFLSAGTSSGGFFLPEVRVDGMLFRKLLEKKNLVASAGFTYYRAKDVYTDKALLLGLTYYFDAPWIVQVGARLNRSDPGNVRSNRGTVAVTYGRDKDQYITLRYDGGREAYQLTGEQTVLSDFTSHEVSLNWRKWFTKRYGINLRAVYYENPSYKRKQAEIGFFVEF